MGAYWNLVQTTHVDCYVCRPLWEDSGQKTMSFLPKDLADDLFLLKNVQDKLKAKLADVNPLVKYLYLMGY